MTTALARPNTATARQPVPATTCRVPAPVPAGAAPEECEGRRIAAADFFTQARSGRALTTLPAFADGDCISCPQGYLWWRHNGQWIKPAQPNGLTVTDRTVTGWWRQRTLPGSRRFALVHTLASHELDRIAAAHYLGRYIDHIDTAHEQMCQQTVTGTWLRRFAAHAIHSRTTTVHLELPSGIVTVHSRTQGDVFYHPLHA
ncbi:hypothetical protein ACF06P_08850 [Streptomyces sp. NPDC015684]|uniref:hypothetical protein n=1 Tax=Streptomyces sp. NPDC015684 TaxID=3364963 RepID=UPI0036F8308E